MRFLAVAVILTAFFTAAANAQAFEDVPPWHWAREAIDRLAVARVIVGFPPNNRDLAVNAVTQVYESFAHASHPDVQAWAERFLTNLPAGWPQPLQRSSLVRYRLEQFGVRFGAQGAGRVSFVAVTAVRSAGATTSRRVSVQAEVQQDRDGRWRVNYSSLASAQPEIFR